MGKKIFLVIALFFLLTENIYAQQVQKLEQRIDEKTLAIYIEKIQVLSGMSSQIEVLDLQYNEGVVTIDFSPTLLEYGGGNYTERMIGTLMMEMVFDFTQAKALTILVKGKEDSFPEGNDFSYCTREAYNMYYKLSEDYDEDYSICNQKPRESTGNQEDIKGYAR